MKKHLALLFFLMSLSACVVGMPAFRAGGVATVVHMPNHRPVRGELLASMPDHIVVMDTSRTIFAIYHSAIRTASFKGAGVLISDVSAPTESMHALMRAMSAFPQGISDSLMIKVRAAHAATGPNVIRQ